MLKKYTIALALIVLSSLDTLAQAPAQSCGTPDSLMVPNLERYYHDIDKLTRKRTSFGETLIYRLAVDINYKTYLLYGGDKLQIKKVLHEFVSKASEVFERDVNIKLVITDILIWDQPEPYALQEDYDYYKNVVEYWTDKRPGDRDCVVSFSSRSGWFYGGGRMCTSNFPSPNATLLKVDLLCHELGHTLGSPHTHSCFWPGGPIDVCTTTEGIGEENCEAGPYTEIVSGSIMSYCRNVLEFHPLCKNIMRDYAEGNGIGGAGFVMKGITPVETVNLTLQSEDHSGSSPIPAFQWRSTYRTETFRLQIARDPGFLQTVADTMLGQPFYHSGHFAENTYHVRVRAETAEKNGPWSNVLPFQMPGLSSHRNTPQLSDPIMFSNGSVRASFINDPEALSYEVELIDAFNKTTLFSQQGQAHGKGVHRLELKTSEHVYWSTTQIRIRVRYSQGWSNWSGFPIDVKRQWENKLFPTTPLEQVSATPALSFEIIQGYEHLGLTHFLEVSTDESFSNIVLRDSSVSNNMDKYYSNKFSFNPKLEENSRYYVRTRVRNLPGQYSEWSVFPLQTQRTDLRFSFLGVLPKFSKTAGRSGQQILTAAFYKSGNRLYVYGNNYGGYYVTTDLKNWKEYSTHTTKGKLPSSMMAFAASAEGEAFLFSPPNTLARVNANETIDNLRTSESIHSYSQSKHAYITGSEGIFFISQGRGIVRLKNTDARFYGQETLGSSEAIALARDSQDRIWALMQGGNVYVFDRGNWSFHSGFPYWNAAGAFCFDNDNIPYLYGDFGVARWNHQNWQNISAVKGYPIKKAVFDNKNQLWMASYYGDWSEEIKGFSLLKLKNDQLSSYTDGLNFLKEVFDLEYFGSRLLIMTTGGEIHAFDETNFQRFQPSANYCHGDEVSVTVTSNSGFGHTNRFGWEFVNIQTGQTLALEPKLDGKDVLSAQIPSGLPDGTYRLRTRATDPEVLSNESEPFNVTALPKPGIESEKQSNFRYRLQTVSSDRYNYQWLLNGSPLAGETKSTLYTSRQGDYSVVVTNTGGCTDTSEIARVTFEEPEELTLLQNVPNPFSNLTSIAFYLPASVQGRVEMFDHNGRLVSTLKEGLFDRGWREIVVHGNTISAGIYVFRLTTTHGTRSLRVVKH